MKIMTLNKTTKTIIHWWVQLPGDCCCTQMRALFRPFHMVSRTSASCGSTTGHVAACDAGDGRVVSSSQVVLSLAPSQSRVIDPHRRRRHLRRNCEVQRSSECMTDTQRLTTATLNFRCCRRQFATAPCDYHENLRAITQPLNVE